MSVIVVFLRPLGLRLLRNVALTPPYSHNGYFATLKDMVMFINNRVNSNAQPEVPANLTTEIGNLGLTDSQVDDLVAFLLTLTDRNAM